MDSALAALEARVAALEARLRSAEPTGATTLVAPVRVVDSAGRLIVEIESNARGGAALRLFNAAGQPVAGLGVDGTETGYLSLRDEQGALVALLDVELAGARLLLTDRGEQAGVVLHGGDAGGPGGGVLILGPGEIGVQLWADASGGSITITDPEGAATTIPPP